MSPRRWTPAAPGAGSCGVRVGNEIVVSVRLKVFDGEVEPFRHAVARLVSWVEAAEPDVLLYRFFLDEDATAARAIHVYADWRALERHNATSSGPIREVLEHCTLIDVEVLGDLPSEAVQGASAYHRPGVLASIAGFARR